MDYNPNAMKWERKNIHCYSCIGFTHIHPDGCMVWCGQKDSGRSSGLLKRINLMPRGTKSILSPSQDNTVSTFPRELWSFSLGIPFMLWFSVLALRWNTQVPRTLNSRTTVLISFSVCTEEAVTNVKGEKNTIIQTINPFVMMISNRMTKSCITCSKTCLTITPTLCMLKRRRI